MNSLVKKILGVFIGVLFIFTIIFGLCWYYDGFNVALITFFGSQTQEAISAIFSAVGVWNWFIAAVIAFIITGLIEWLIGHRLSNRKAGIILDAVLGVFSFIGFIFLFK